MARRGLFRKIQQIKDAILSRVQDNIFDAVETLAKDHDVVSAPVTTLIMSAAIPPGASIVAYGGGPSQTLTLPAANALGTNVGAVVFFLNTASIAVTIVPSRGDTLNGGASLSLAAGVLCVLASDGVSKWLRNV